MDSATGTELATLPRFEARTARLLDRVEQIGIIVLWTWLSFRVFNSDNGYAWLALVSETTILVFVLIRRRTDAISLRLDDWLLALSATFLPGFVVMTGEPTPGLAGLAVMMVLTGDIFQIWAKLALARSFGLAPANRGIKTHGPYTIVRHPMYTGYCLAQVGVLIALPSVTNFVLIAAAWAMQVLRIGREERLLSRDPAYRAMMEKVRWRLLPGIW